jgi:hypothetical protein
VLGGFALKEAIVAKTTTHIGAETWATFLRGHEELIPCHLLGDDDEPLCGAELVIPGSGHTPSECPERGCERCMACAAIDDYVVRMYDEVGDDDA